MEEDTLGATGGTASGPGALGGGDLGDAMSGRDIKAHSQAPVRNPRFEQRVFGKLCIPPCCHQVVLLERLCYATG